MQLVGPNALNNFKSWFGCIALPLLFWPINNYAVHSVLKNKKSTSGGCRCSALKNLLSF